MLRITIALLLFLTSVTASANESCSFPIAANPCQAHVAASHTTPLLAADWAGNPIHVGTGNKQHWDTDLFETPTSALSFKRIYQAHGHIHSELGGQWRHNYDYYLHQSISGPPHYQLRLPTNQLLPLALGTSEHGHLQQHAQQLIWTHSNGTQYTFLHGRLQRIQHPEQHEAVYLHYYADSHTHAGRLQRITQGDQHLTFHHTPSGHLQALDSPYGRIQFHYQHLTAQGRPRLQHIHYPDQRRLHYHYEQPEHTWSLTGTSVQHQPNGLLHRIRYWQYDTQGRAIFSAHEMGQDWVRVEYPTQPDLPARLHSAKGVQKQYTHDHRLYQVSGSNCPGCPPSPYRLHRHAEGGWTLNQRLHFSPNDKGYTLRPYASGWSQLQLHYNHQAHLTAWHSQHTGTTQFRYHPNGTVQQIHYANDNRHELRYDTLSRPTAFIQHNTEQSIRTEITWPQPNHVVFTHPNETLHLLRQPEQWHYQSQRAHRNHSDDFHYDVQARVERIVLSEGGELHYHWHSTGLAELQWQPAEKEAQRLLHHTPNGYRYANNSELVLRRHADGTAYGLALRVTQQDQYYALRHYDAQQQLVGESHRFPQLQRQQQRWYHYAAIHTAPHQNQASEARPLTAIRTHTQHANTDSVSQQHLHWTPDGHLVAHSHLQPYEIQRDRSGLPQQLRSTHTHYHLRYNAGRQLAQVDDTSGTIARFRYNALGQLLSAHYAHETRQFYYHEQQLQFEERYDAAQQLQEQRRYIYVGNTVVAMLRYRPQHSTEWYAVHSDWLGAPFMLTAENGDIAWAAELDSFGNATLLLNHIDMPIRYLGQYADPVLGWHHNGYRIYLPQLGQYLEPDPVGPMVGQQAFGYAQQRPRQYADPLGLALFVFDGTRLDRFTHSNARLLSQLSKDEDGAYYHAGPGSSLLLNWDAITAYRAHQIIETQWLHFLNLIETHQKKGTPVLHLDVIGYSRGAALARHFANRILQHSQEGWFSFQHPHRGQLAMCVQPRFMGLFDTVAQFGINGSHNFFYNFKISPAWQWVAHAVALHEYRTLFPLHSVYPKHANHYIEQPFIGAHNDIGGGAPTLTAASPDTELSRTTLMWMLWQARAVGLQFAEPPAPTTPVSHALLHDDRSAPEKYLSFSDRHVIHSNSPSHGHPQATHPLYGQRARKETEAFITRFSIWEATMHKAVGSVDMAAYHQWLHDYPLRFLQQPTANSP